MDQMAIREAVFAWVRNRSLTQPVFARDELGAAEILGQSLRLVGTQTGIWTPAGWNAALSIVTGYYPEGFDRPYNDSTGPDGLMRYKWRGTDPDHWDNRALRAAMTQGLPLLWFIGIAYRPGTRTQVFQPVFPVWLIAEEPAHHQFVVAVDADQRALVTSGVVAVNELERRYNEGTVRVRLHQPLFRTRVLHAYTQRCAVCGLPFSELLDAAHIKSDSEGGPAAVSNGLALCRIHHGAFDTSLLGIDADYRVAIREDVLDTFDGPTLQHALKEMNGQRLRVVPGPRAERPRRDLLDERFQRFLVG